MFNFFKKKETQQPIFISLKDLSTVWTKYNRVVDDETVKTVKTQGVIIPVPLSAVQDNQDDQGQDKVMPDTEPAPASMQVPPPALSESAYHTFVQDIVQPYRDYCIAQNALDPIIYILKLLETEGSCPSIGKIGIGSRMSETDNDYLSIQDALSRVTLRDHSHRVAMIAIRLLKATYADYESLVPKMLVCALAHDIGKIPSLRENVDEYVKADHPILGGKKLREILSSFDEAVRVSWLDSAVQAVESHHQKTKDSFLSILQAADSQARKAEIELYRKDFVFLEWAEWFSPQDFLEALKKKINVVAPNTKNQWQTFSFNGVVYAKTDILIDVTNKQAKDKKVFDLRLLRSHRDKEAALYAIVNSLKEAQVIFGNNLAPNYLGEDYEIDHGQYKEKQFLVPLKIESFGMASEIEKDKSGFFYGIQGIRPMRRPQK